MADLDGNGTKSKLSTRSTRFSRSRMEGAGEKVRNIGIEALFKSVVG